MADSFTVENSEYIALVLICLIFICYHMSLNFFFHRVAEQLSMGPWNHAYLCLVILVFISITLGVGSKEHCCYLHQSVFCLCFPLGI